MSKKEESYAINDELIDQKVELPVKYNKIKYAIVIASVVAFVAAASILLIGYLNLIGSKAKHINSMPISTEPLIKPVTSLKRKE